MEDNITEQTMGMGPDIDLMDSKVHIVQDVEEDLEEYTRLTRIGRFEEASQFFRKTLYRHIGCFAVLAEHCNALVYQGDYTNASAVLNASIARQEASVTGPGRFRASEMHFLRALLAYVNIFSETTHYIDRHDAKITVSHARWYRDSITATESRKLLDVERQILLTCVRIFILFIEQDYAVLEDLRLPWSSRPLYPGETLKLSEDYLAWFEALLPEHPWDACIVFEGIGRLRPQTSFFQDYWIMMDLVEQNFPDSASNSVDLFARMLLLGKLCEVALIRRWCRSGSFNARPGFYMYQIVVSSESEQLVEKIQDILEQHSETDDVAKTGPYKHLQLLMIEHEVMREQKPMDAREPIRKLLPRLSAIEKFAASPEISNHQLALDVIYHQYIFLEKREWRKIMLNKIAHFISRFGATQETMSLHSSILDKYDLFSTLCHPNRTFVVSEIIRLSHMIKGVRYLRSFPRTGDLYSGKGQSIFEDILHDIEDQEHDEASQNGRLDHWLPYQVESSSTRYPETLEPATSRVPHPSYSAPMKAPRHSAPVRASYNPFMPTDYANLAGDAAHPTLPPATFQTRYPFYPPASYSDPLTIPTYSAPAQTSYDPFMPTDHARSSADAARPDYHYEHHPRNDEMASTTTDRSSN